MANARLSLHVASLFIAGILVNLALTFSLVLKAFSENYAWNLACDIATALWGYMQNHWESTLNAQECLTFSGDAIPQKEAAVVISNHIGYADYYLVHALASRAGMLGRCRYFAKKSLVYQIPIFGWSLWAVGMILVSRNWTSDQGLIRDAFARVKMNAHDCWIILYPEGTRRTDRKVIQSQAFARAHGKPELSNVLYPRTRGFVSTIQELRDSHVKYVYDLTFSYTGPSKRVPTLAEILSCADLTQAGYAFHINIKRTAIATLPTDEAGLQAWLEVAWQRKDGLLA